MDPPSLVSLLGPLDPSKGEYEGWTFATEIPDSHIEWMLSLDPGQPPPADLELEKIALPETQHQELPEQHVENWRERITFADRATLVGHLAEECTSKFPDFSLVAHADSKKLAFNELNYLHNCLCPCRSDGFNPA